jgi:DNA-binding response OmpR family regulator
MQKILLVEDDPFLSSLLKNRLQKEGFEVIHARDGEEAITALRTTPVHLVLLDIILPKRSGFEVMEEIRTDGQVKLQNSNLPIIIISNLGQAEDMEKGKELGAIEYFVKAKTSIDDLVGRVKDFVSGPTPEAQTPVPSI